MSSCLLLNKGPSINFKFLIVSKSSMQQIHSVIAVIQAKAFDTFSLLYEIMHKIGIKTQKKTPISVMLK